MLQDAINEMGKRRKESSLCLTRHNAKVGILITCIQKARQIIKAKHEKIHLNAFPLRRLNQLIFSTLSHSVLFNVKRTFPAIISEQIIYNENLIENCVVNVYVRLGSLSIKK